MKKMCNILLGLTVAFFLANLCIAAEHPGTTTGEHPSTKTREHSGTTHQAEHPGEHSLFSAEQIIKGIKDHINNVTKANNGIFPLTDPQDGNLKLILIKVHEDKVSYIKKEDAYFACTDFITSDGKTRYDVDFWMKEGKKEKLEVYQTKIHKQDGTPRFIYKDDEIVELKTEGHEHPGTMAPEEHR